MKTIPVMKKRLVERDKLVERKTIQQYDKDGELGSAYYTYGEELVRLHPKATHYKVLETEMVVLDIRQRISRRSIYRARRSSRLYRTTRL